MFPIRKSIIFIVVLCLVLSACQSLVEQSETPTPSEVFQLTDCQLSAPGTVARIDARCGSYEVFENPETQTGRKIRLNLAVIPAVSRNPAPDPLFFLTGGPGQAATESFLQLSGAFSRLNQKRDIILIDQRGTGGSNPINCTYLEESEADEADLEALVNTCLAELDADPRFYTTSIAMQDLDQIREIFGYERINLYGVSYGTRAALTYMKYYPEHVRTAILDGVVPQHEALGSEVAGDAQRALDMIFERCQTDTECSEAFPEVEEDFYTLLENVSGQPVETMLIDPLSGAEIEQEFHHEELVTAIRLLSYSPETVALLPLLIDTAFSRQDYAPLAAQYQIVANDLTASISSGMGYAVLCSEDFPYMDAEKATEASADTYYGELQIEGLEEICRLWPAGEVPEDFKEPVEVDIPVLLLSGENDPVTPPENAAEAAEYLPNSLALVAPGQGHNVIFRGCLPDVAFDFIESGSLENLDVACVQEIAPAPFFINFNGPIP